MGEVDPPAQVIVVAAPTSPHVLAAGVNVNSLGMSTETFDGLTAGSPNNGAGRGNFDSDALGAHFSASGNAGILSAVRRSVTRPRMSDRHRDTRTRRSYLSIGGNATETITFTSDEERSSACIGARSIPTIPSSFTTERRSLPPIPAPISARCCPNGNQGSFASNGYVEFTGLHSFNKVVLSQQPRTHSRSTTFPPDTFRRPTLEPVTGTLSVHDADIGDTLTAFVAGNATIEYNGSTTMPGGIDISALLNAGNVTFDSMLSNGGTAVLQWTYHPINADLDFLHAGDVLKINFVAEVSDGHGHNRKPAADHHARRCRCAANASNTSAAGPVIETDAFTVTERDNGADSFGPTDQVHFIFNQGGTGPDVTLTGTSGKDVIFATGHADTLTGGVSADQFVFAPETSPSADTITDFKPGEDHIDLRAFSFVDSSNIASWLGTHATTSGADTLISLNSGDTITLKNIALASLHASDFIVTPHH